MTVSLDEIREMIGARISGSKPRQKIQKWAEERMNAGARQELAYEPVTEAERIWEALVFMANSQHQEGSRSFIEFRDKNNLRISTIRISLEDVRTALNALISGEKSRDEIDRWACGLMAADDRRELEYLPSQDEDRIWKGILSLSGVDTRVGPDGPYLYGTEDFITWRDELGLS